MNVVIVGPFRGCQLPADGGCLFGYLKCLGVAPESEQPLAEAGERCRQVGTVENGVRFGQLPPDDRSLLIGSKRLGMTTQLGKRDAAIDQRVGKLGPVAGRVSRGSPVDGGATVRSGALARCGPFSVPPGAEAGPVRRAGGKPFAGMPRVAC